MPPAPSISSSSSLHAQGHLLRPEPLLFVLILPSLLLGSIALIAWQTISSNPLYIAGLGFDRLSGVLTLLVAAVGLVTYRFSVRYLVADPARGRFLGWLGFTIIAAYILMLSNNLLLLMIAWSLTGIGLDRLLRHYPNRIEAIRSARKKFLISRLGDMALLAAILICWLQWHTLDLHTLAVAMAAPNAQEWVTTVLMLIVLAALTKSAQFPFHSWLPETMESPTPVSALMHAGIINAGGALLLRFAPVLAQEPAALLLLTAIGTVTACLGMVAMWTQVKVKRTLAWSTVSQMGFMMIQFGLGVFSIAVLHLVAHGCYKAWSFLQSGQVPRETNRMHFGPVKHLLQVAAGAALALPALVLGSWLTGFKPWHSPSEAALLVIIMLSIGQLWPVMLATSHHKIHLARRLLVSAGLTFGISLFACGLYRSVEIYFEPILGMPVHFTSWVAWLIASIPVVAMVMLTVLHALLPTLGRRPAWQSWRVHAMHGFYFGVIADRVVAAIWKHLLHKGKTHA